jgi:hypothetical protein
MIDQHERERVRSAIAEFLDSAPPAPAHPPVRIRQSSSMARKVPRRRLIVSVAAAAVAVAGLAGLVVFARRTPPPGPAAEPTVPSPPLDAGRGRPLSSTDEITSSNWVVATVLPDGLEFLYALRTGPALDGDQQRRSIAYGAPRGRSDDEQLWVEVAQPYDGTPDESLTIGDVVWLIDPQDSSGLWSASTSVSGTTLNVRGAGGDVEQVLAGLSVVDESELPFAPLGDPDDAVVVARTSLLGETYTYSVQESGRYSCGWVMSPTGMGSGCASLAQPDADLTVDGEFGETTATGIVTVRSGSASPAAASVEVVFADGTTTTVEPTDFSGTFGRLFWIAASTSSTTSQTGPPVTDGSVAEVRAYDAAGNLIASADLP